MPVREAFLQLESEGLITVVPNKGASVTRLSLSDRVEAYRIRERLEPLALGQSVPRLPEEAIGRIEELCSAIEQADSIEALLSLEQEFHLLSYQGVDMPKLQKMVESFWNSTRQYRRAYEKLTGAPGQWTSNVEHRLILDALKRRDAEDAERLIFGHTRRTRLGLESHIEIFDEAAAPKHPVNIRAGLAN